MSVSLKGPWSADQISEFLHDNVFPVRLACVGADGFPRVVSVWYQYHQGQFICASHQDSQLVAMLRESNKVGFEVAPNHPPYSGVRGQGLAELTNEGAGEALDGLLKRYLGDSDSSLGKWLLSRRDEEVLITVTPQRMFSWDYRERMDSA